MSISEHAILKPSLSGLKERLAESFQQEYRGLGVHGLYEFVGEMDKRYEQAVVGIKEQAYSQRAYYAKFISVVQSSGVGKTRTIFEVRML